MAMKLISCRGLVFLAMVAGVVPAAMPHGATIHHYRESGRPVIGELDEDGYLTEKSVWVTPWNWIASQGAFSTSDPGWSWDSTVEFSHSLSFRIVAPLRRWNGLAFVPSGRQVRITLGTNTLLTSSTSPTMGYATLVGANDHFHYRFNLVGVAQNDPTSVGVYRLDLEAIHLGGPSAVTFPRFALLFNRGAAPAVVSAAVSATQLRNPVQDSPLGAPGKPTLVGRRGL